MLVKELIAKLQECDPNKKVCLSKDVQIGEYTWTTTEIEIMYVQKDCDCVVLEA